MKRFCTSLLLCFGLLHALASPAHAESVAISMMYSNSSVLGLPFDLFRNGRWQPDPQARFVKLHLYFDRQVTVGRFQIQPCGKALPHPVTVFTNFDESIWRVNDTEAYSAPWDTEQLGNLIQGEMEDGIEMRSMTINFESNQGFALCGLKLFDKDKKPISLIVPELVKGSANASSTLQPQAAYDVFNLFDSRFESAWASNKLANNVTLQFHFEQAQSVTRLRLWSGYQRSHEHCVANSRPKLLRIEGENGYLAKVAVKDIMGAQEIALPRPYAGKSLNITVEDSFKGKAYADLVISELRFGNDKGWFMLDPLPHIRTGIAANREQFKAANLQSILDDGLLGKDQSILRLRSDGSVYLGGTYTSQDKGEMHYFFVGNYEIKAKDAAKGLQLRLFGLFHESEAYGDCNGCGRDCNRPDGEVEKIFQETVWLKEIGNQEFQLTAVNPKRLKKAPIRYRFSR